MGERERVDGGEGAGWRWVNGTWGEGLWGKGGTVREREREIASGREGEMG